MALEFADVIQLAKREKTGAAPTQIPPDFYTEMGALIERVRVEYEKHMVADPTSMKTSQLFDMLRQLRDTQNEIVGVRMRKVLLMAHQQMCGGVPDKKSLTLDEVEALDSVVGTLAKLRAKVRATKEPEKITGNEHETTANL